MSRIPRRTLLKGAVIAGAISQVPQVAHATSPTHPASAVTPPATGPAARVLDDGVPLRWLEDRPPDAFIGTTWGVPWPRGTLTRGRTLRLTTGEGQAVPVQSWPIGYWPDGTIKWTAHAIGPEFDPAQAYPLQCCRLYNGTAAEQQAETGQSFGNLNLRQDPVPGPGR